jgi:hypothetical protein
MEKQNQQKGLMRQTHSTCLLNLQNNNQPLSPIQLVELASDLLPKGNPNFKAMRNFTPIKVLLDNEVATITDIRCALLVLVKNFSESMNVVRNLNETQAVEITEMLIDECGDFRLEDYFIMFQLAKRGKIGDIRDRIDIQLICKLKNEYKHYRDIEGEKLLEELDKEMAEKRREQKRKALGSGETSVKVISTQDFMEELAKIQKAMVENIDKHTLDEVKQNEKRKEMLYNRMKDIYGFSEQELLEMQNIKIKTFGSKINDK